MQEIAEMLFVHGQAGPYDGAVLRVRQDYDEDDYYAAPVVLVTDADASRLMVVESSALGGKVEAWGGFRITSSGPTWTIGTGAPSVDEPIGSLYSDTAGGALYFKKTAGWVSVTTE